MKDEVVKAPEGINPKELFVYVAAVIEAEASAR
jgi:hypothetical protein